MLAGGQPVKAVYFFAGEGDNDNPLYTTHPTLPDDHHPEIPHLNFQADFPHPQGTPNLAPGLIKKMGWLVQIFRNDMNRWAQIYDLNGEVRYAINILHACSDERGVNAAAFASGFGAHAEFVRTKAVWRGRDQRHVGGYAGEA